MVLPERQHLSIRLAAMVLPTALKLHREVIIVPDPKVAELRRLTAGEGRSVITPASADQGRQSLRFLQLLLILRPLVGSTRETPVEDEVGNALRMPHRKGA